MPIRYEAPTALQFRYFRLILWFRRSKRQRTFCGFGEFRFGGDCENEKNFIAKIQESMTRLLLLDTCGSHSHTLYLLQKQKMKPCSSQITKTLSALEILMMCYNSPESGLTLQNQGFLTSGH